MKNKQATCTVPVKTQHLIFSLLYTMEPCYSSHTGTNNSGWINEVAGFQGKEVFNVEDGSLNQSMPELLAVIARWLQFRGLE